jgi:hypothetical protein
MHWDDVRDALYPDTADREDFTCTRVERLLRHLRGEPASTVSGREGVVEEWSDHVQPHPPAWPGAPGTAAAACARHGGPASTACTC